MVNQEPQKKKSCLSSIGCIVPFLIIALVIAFISINLLGNKDINVDSDAIVMNYKNAGLYDDSFYLSPPSHVRTFILLGSDYRPESGYRTDVILLVSVNLREAKINLLSFPRDLWVTIPGYDQNRINVVHPWGGFELLSETLLYNFDFIPQNYLLVDFQGFKEIVNLLGGIDVKVTASMEDHCEFNPQRWCRVDPGVVHMDGEYALWYVRARYNSSDFDRTRRAQEVIQAIVKRTLRFNNLIKASQLISAVNEFIETDVTFRDVFPLLIRTGKLTNDDAFTSYIISPNEATGWITSGGADVLIPNYPAIREILLKVLWMEAPQE